jgi:hypothetical protein
MVTPPTMIACGPIQTSSEITGKPVVRLPSAAIRSPWPSVTPWNSETSAPMTASVLTTAPQPWNSRKPGPMRVFHGRSTAAFALAIRCSAIAATSSGRDPVACAAWQSRSVSTTRNVRSSSTARSRRARE